MDDTMMTHYILGKAVEISEREQITRLHAVEKVDKHYKPETLSDQQEYEWGHIITGIREFYKNYALWQR